MENMNCQLFLYGPPVSRYVIGIRSHLIAGIQLFHSGYGIDCAFNQLMLIAQHIHGLPAPSQK